MTVKKTTVLANELRIGNWVDYSDYPSKGFTRLNEYLMTCVFSDENWINHFISPIHLTEEILLKCGFEFNDNSHRQISKPSIFIEELRYIYKINDFEIRLFKGRYYYNNIEIKYLHQLQNLYFALTNQELNIEL